MDNFKPTRRTFGNRHAVDGFVSSRPSRPAQARQPEPTFHAQKQPGPIAQFRQTGGFTSNNDPLLSGLSSDTKAPLSGGSNDSRRSKRRHKPKRSKGKKILRALAAVFVLIVLGVGGMAGYAYLKTRQIFKGDATGAAALEKNVDPVKLKGEGDGRINVMMIGVGGDGHDGAYLTDTIIVASVDPVQNEAALVSIPRDLWVKKENGDPGKINEVFALARQNAYAKNKDFDAATKTGTEALEKVLTQVLGIPINYYIYIDFNGFQKAIDTIGGVDINVTPELAVTETLLGAKPYTLDVKPGMVHFDGLKALYYSRSRHTSLRGDFDRAERQKAVVVAFKEKVMSIGTYANPIKVTQLLSTFGDHVRTDLSINEVMRLYDIGKNISADKVASIGLADPPNVLVTGDSIEGLSVQVPKAGLYNYSAIQSFIRNSIKDAFIKLENANILILNGTSTEGLASSKATELRSYGYNVTGTGNGPNKNFAKTVIVDMRNGEKKYTKNYLEKRFGVSAVTSLPDPTIVAGTADFVIILGTDAVTPVSQ